MEKDRIYVDTSVFGGVFDDEFENVSKEFFQQIKDNQLSLVTSALVQEEILEAPQKVINFFDSILPFVHFKKIPLYNAVNILQGYGQIAIYSPLEVIRYEE